MSYDGITASIEAENGYLRTRVRELEHEVESLRAYLRDTMIRDSIDATPIAEGGVTLSEVVSGKD